MKDSDKPSECHFWASGMRREVAQNYLLDLCGSESQNYTEIEAEVTCERCLAALRVGSAPSSPGAPEPRSEDAITLFTIDFLKLPVVVEQVRAAVLKEREEIVQLVQAMRDLDGNADYKTALRQVIDEIRRRK